MLSQRLFFSEPSIANNYQYQYRSNTITADGNSRSNSATASTAKSPSHESSSSSATVAATVPGSVNEQRIHLTSSPNQQSKSPRGSIGHGDKSGGTSAISPSLSSIQKNSNGTTTITTSSTAAGTASATSTMPPSPSISPVKYIEELFLKSPGGPTYLKQVKDQIKQQITFPKPSKEDIDVYDVDIVRAIRAGDLPALHSILQTKGPQVFNGCNRFGESLLHMACRRGNRDVVYFLLQTAHVTIERYDDYGRTPLHDACWTSQPNIPIVQLLITKCTPTLLLSRDIRGHTPFHYARAEHHPTWEAFLQQNETLLLLRISLYMSTLSSLPATVQTIAPASASTSPPVVPSMSAAGVERTTDSTSAGANLKSLTSASILTSSATSSQPVATNVIAKENPPPANISSISTTTSISSSISTTEAKSADQRSLQQQQQMNPLLQQQQLSMVSPNTQPNMITARNITLQQQPSVQIQQQQQQQNTEYQQAQQLRMQQYIQLHFQQLQNQLQQNQLPQAMHHPGQMLLQNQNQVQSFVAMPQPYTPQIPMIMQQQQQSQQIQSKDPPTQANYSLQQQQQAPAKVEVGSMYMKSMSVSANGVVNVPWGGVNGSGSGPLFGISQQFPAMGQQQQQQSSPPPLQQQQQSNLQVQMLQQQYLQRQTMLQNLTTSSTIPEITSTTGGTRPTGTDTKQSSQEVEVKEESDNV